MIRKTIFSLSVAAAALAGCSQNELLTEHGSAQGNDERSISFGSYVSRPTSRAAGMDLTDFQANGRFKAWAYVTTDAAGLSDDLATAVNIDLHTALSGGSAMNGSDLFARITDPEDAGKFIWTSGSKKYYWPADGLGKMTFYALSATDGTGFPSVATLTTPTNADGATFDYTVGTNGADATQDKQEDLMAAQVYDLEWTTDRETSKVVLDFKHLLTQVRFTAKTSDASYRVKILSLKVKGANNEGTFAFDPTATAAPIGSWSIADATKRADYTYFDATATGAQVADFATGFPKDDAAPANHFVSTSAVDFPLFGADEVEQALIMLPSVAKAADGTTALGLKGVSIEVSYQCYILSGTAGEDGTAVAHWVKDGTVLSRKIELTENETWTMNKKVCYNLTLFNSNSGKIVYTPVVTPWEDQSGDSNLYPDTDAPATPAPPVP